MGKPDQGSAAAAGARRATGDATDRAGRFSAGRKRAVVLRLLRGEDLESVSRELGITAARASQWREQFLAAGPPRRPGPVGAASDDVLVGHIRRVLAVSWRRVSESLGEAAGGGDPHREGPGTPVNARARPAGAAPHGPRAWPGGARWDDHHRGPRRDVGTDMTTTVTVGEGTACKAVRRDRRSLYDRVHRAACGQEWQPLRVRPAEPIRQGDPPGRPRTLRGHRRRRCVRVAFAARPRVTVPGGRLPTGDRLLRHRELPQLRAGARRQRRRGALHPDAQGERLVGAELRDDRATPPRLTRVQADVQRAVDAGEVRLSQPGARAPRPRRAGHGSVDMIACKPLSKNPGAIHSP